MSGWLSEQVRGLAERAGLGGLSARSLAALAVAAAVLVGVAAWRFWPRAAPPEATFGSGAASVTAEAGQAPAGADGGAVFVHVVGAVLHPGVYELSPGSRVADAIDAAGGALGSADACALNLARVLVDGEQVRVPVVGDDLGDAGGPAGGGASPVGADGSVNINTADAEALQTLPGVGPSTAEKIIADRETNGPFAAPEDLMRVPGIGEKKFEAMRDLVRTQ